VPIAAPAPPSRKTMPSNQPTGIEFGNDKGLMVRSIRPAFRVGTSNAAPHQELDGKLAKTSFPSFLPLTVSYVCFYFQLWPKKTRRENSQRGKNKLPGNRHKVRKTSRRSRHLALLVAGRHADAVVGPCRIDLAEIVRAQKHARSAGPGGNDDASTLHRRVRQAPGRVFCRRSAHSCRPRPTAVRA